MADITSIYGNPIKDAQARQDISDLKEEISELSVGVPTTVRQAIKTMFETGAYADTGLTDEMAVISSWASQVTAITLNQSSISISGATTSQLVATTTPTGGTVTWSSSDTSVAAVSSNGLVTGVGNGTAKITATSGDVSATCTATVSGFRSLVSISAVYTQSGTVYDTDSLDDLKTDLVVTGLYDDQSTETITNYTLSGTLEVGTSTIVVSYSGKTTTFNVTVTAEPVPTFALNRAIAVDGLTLSSGYIDDNGEVVSSSNSYFVDEFYDGEKVAYIRDDTLITFTNNQAGRSAYYDSANNFVKRAWINSGSSVQAPNFEQYAKQKLGWTMAENPDYAIIFTPIDDSLFVNEKTYLGTNGELTSNNGYSTTDYLEVPSNAKYLAANPNVQVATTRLCFYDINKAMVQRLAITATPGLVLYGEIPSNAVYFRFDKANNVSAYSPFVKF